MNLEEMIQDIIVGLILQIIISRVEETKIVHAISISDAISVTEEELNYLRKIASMEKVNRYEFAEVAIQMKGI